ncbi:hypothetical protein FHR84_001851 [Actinopolyspora biskrensis]|uniref:DUF4232 domain-containing protein n=1 Tax=Actinopolyspora biskrensis TaxID=1470178 RepID=A0A852Z4K4_9ACTN|nr:hypothetical protein [Actinopolyspora biskrensis]NYH78526.1 hypothetical protein [Actinopolyspora biskrensis]
MKRSTITTSIAATLLATGAMVSTAFGATAATQGQQDSSRAAAPVSSCTAGDLSIDITKDPHGGAGQQAFAVHYTAADADTHCLMQGFPTNVRFYQPNGEIATGIFATAEHTVAEAVTIDADHSGVSYFVQPATGQHNAVGSVSFRTPTGVQRNHVEVAWPDEPVHGAELKVTPVSQA